jgi:hypothetical protein
MVPQYIIFVSSIPTTLNGKVDRHALRSLKSCASSVKLSSSDNFSSFLRLVIDSWRRCFGLDYVGVDEPFFALGGDSVIACRIAVELRHHGILVDAADILKYPSIRALMSSPALREYCERRMSGEENLQ